MRKLLILEIKLGMSTEHGDASFQFDPRLDFERRMELEKPNIMLTLEFPKLKNKPFFHEENCSTEFD